MADRFCACQSADAHNCWSLRYHGHTGVSELTVNREGGPCECSCHEDHEGDRDEANEIPTEKRSVTVGMVTAALAAVGEHNVSLSSMRRLEVTKMIQAALDWMDNRDAPS